MPYHRSIVRIRRRESNDRSFNCCLGVVCYILLNLMLQNYVIALIVVNGIVVLAISATGLVILYEKYKNENIENIENIEYPPIEAQVIEYDSSIVDMENITVVVAVPINE